MDCGGSRGLPPGQGGLLGVIPLGGSDWFDSWPFNHEPCLHDSIMSRAPLPPQNADASDRAHN